MRRTLLAVGLAALALGASGCGSDKDPSAVPPGSELGPPRAGGAAGARVFADAGCGNCHTLAAAGASGQIGPSLDDARPTYARAVAQVTSGGSGMPSFSSSLSEDEIRDVAAFVSASAAKGGSRPKAQQAALFKPDSTKLADCGEDFDCLQQAFGNLTYERGPKVALAEFERRMRTDNAVEAGCHRIAHMIGAASLVHFKGNVGKAFAAGSATCWSGVYHGILERAFAGVPRSRLADVARALCEGSDIRHTVFVAYQCVHGLGHGLMIYTGYDLPASLGVCDRLATTWDQTSCTGGVFMENLSSSYGVKSRWLRDDDPIYPCQAVAKRHKLYCYLMVTSRILPTVGFDFAKAARICRRSEPGWVATCFQSLGRDASGQTRGDIGQILDHCSTAGDMARECVFGAARDLTSNDAGARRAAVLCAQAEAGSRSYCYEGIGTILGGLYATEAERRNACSALSPAGRAACARGAGV